MKKLINKLNNKFIIYAIVIACMAITICIFSIPSQFNGRYTKYTCDVKTLNLSTLIDISKDDIKIGKVKGELLKLVEDPLTMYSPDNVPLAYAGDAYHFISQDSHAIYTNRSFSVEMVGLVEIFGESYDIYDNSKNKIATVNINPFNTKGEMRDANGQTIADFYSKPFFNDFEIRIGDNCRIDHYTILMIFCSYYSDYSADN